MRTCTALQSMVWPQPTEHPHDLYSYIVRAVQLQIMPAFSEPPTFAFARTFQLWLLPSIQLRSYSADTVLKIDDCKCKCITGNYSVKFMSLKSVNSNSPQMTLKKLDFIHNVLKASWQLEKVPCLPKCCWVQFARGSCHSINESFWFYSILFE